MLSQIKIPVLVLGFFGLLIGSSLFGDTSLSLHNQIIAMDKNTLSDAEILAKFYANDSMGIAVQTRLKSLVTDEEFLEYWHATSFKEVDQILNTCHGKPFSGIPKIPLPDELARAESLIQLLDGQPDSESMNYFRENWNKKFAYFAHAPLLIEKSARKYIVRIGDNLIINAITRASLFDHTHAHTLKEFSCVDEAAQFLRNHMDDIFLVLCPLFIDNEPSGAFIANEFGEDLLIIGIDPVEAHSMVTYGASVDWDGQMLSPYMDALFDYIDRYYQSL